MKVWFRMYEGAKLLRQDVIEDLSEDTRTHKILNALEAVCHKWNLAQPYWLKKNEQDFLAHAKTRFTKHNFVEEVDFDYLEMSILLEDDIK
ncbi:MAG: hypothetical protein K6G13_08635 [Agathobacter sp.]|uniref:hypothetical protein n=1 Tax=Agathobacter sp. TaxID=2021311 RepID=UPI00258BCFE7|nr:hypothetical protein [Agathobacter sp.]MCR5678081.1 hypothetical protein [Agathobacter sp.]